MDNKTLLETMSRKLDISTDTASQLVGAMAKAIGECGSELDPVSIPGFGTFEPRKRPERVALHPASGKRLLVPPKVVLNFRPSQTLKQRIK